MSTNSWALLVWVAMFVFKVAVIAGAVVLVIEAAKRLF